MSPAVKVLEEAVAFIAAAPLKLFAYGCNRDIWNAVFMLTILIESLYSTSDQYLKAITIGAVLPFAALFGFMASRRSIYWSYLSSYAALFLAIPMICAYHFEDDASLHSNHLLRYIGIVFPYIAHMRPPIIAIVAVSIFTFIEFFWKEMSTVTVLILVATLSLLDLLLIPRSIKTPVLKGVISYIDWDPTEEEYDVVVLGSNLSALSVAAILSQCGKRVLVLESGDTPNGDGSTALRVPLQEQDKKECVKEKDREQMKGEEDKEKLSCCTDNNKSSLRSIVFQSSKCYFGFKNIVTYCLSWLVQDSSVLACERLGDMEDGFCFNEISMGGLRVQCKPSSSMSCSSSFPSSFTQSDAISSSYTAIESELINLFPTEISGIKGFLSECHNNWYASTLSLFLLKVLPPTSEDNLTEDDDFSDDSDITYNLWIRAQLFFTSCPTFVRDVTVFVRTRLYEALNQVAGETAEVAVRRHVQDPLLQSVLIGGESICPSGGVVPSEASAWMTSFLLRSYRDGAYYTLKGMEGIVNSLIDTITRNNGSVVTNVPIQNILLQANGRCLQPYSTYKSESYDSAESDLVRDSSDSARDSDSKREISSYKTVGIQLKEIKGVNERIKIKGIKGNVCYDFPFIIRAPTVISCLGARSTYLDLLKEIDGDYNIGNSDSGYYPNISNMSDRNSSSNSGRNMSNNDINNENISNDIDNLSGIRSNKISPSGRNINTGNIYTGNMSSNMSEGVLLRAGLEPKMLQRCHPRNGHIGAVVSLKGTASDLGISESHNVHSLPSSPRFDRLCHNNVSRLQQIYYAFPMGAVGDSLITIICPKITESISRYINADDIDITQSEPIIEPMSVIGSAIGSRIGSVVTTPRHYNEGKKVEEKGREKGREIEKDNEIEKEGGSSKVDMVKKDSEYKSCRENESAIINKDDDENFMDVNNEDIRIIVSHKSDDKNEIVDQNECNNVNIEKKGGIKERDVEGLGGMGAERMKEHACTADQWEDSDEVEMDRFDRMTGIEGMEGKEGMEVIKGIGGMEEVEEMEGVEGIEGVGEMEGMEGVGMDGGDEISSNDDEEMLTFTHRGMTRDRNRDRDGWDGRDTGDSMGEHEGEYEDVKDEDDEMIRSYPDTYSKTHSNTHYNTHPNTHPYTHHDTHPSNSRMSMYTSSYPTGPILIKSEDDALINSYNNMDYNIMVKHDKYSNHDRYIKHNQFRHNQMNRYNEFNKDDEANNRYNNDKYSDDNDKNEYKTDKYDNRSDNYNSHRIEKSRYNNMPLIREEKSEDYNVNYDIEYSNTNSNNESYDNTNENSYNVTNESSYIEGIEGEEGEGDEKEDQKGGDGQEQEEVEGSEIEKETLVRDLGPPIPDDSSSYGVFPSPYHHFSAPSSAYPSTRPSFSSMQGSTGTNYSSTLPSGVNSNPISGVSSPRGSNGVHFNLSSNLSSNLNSNLSSNVSSNMTSNGASNYTSNYTSSYTSNYTSAGPPSGTATGISTGPSSGVSSAMGSNVGSNVGLNVGTGTHTGTETPAGSGTPTGRTPTETTPTGTTPTGTTPIVTPIGTTLMGTTPTITTTTERSPIMTPTEILTESSPGSPRSPLMGSIEESPTQTPTATSIRSPQGSSPQILSPQLSPISPKITSPTSPQTQLSPLDIFPPGGSYNTPGKISGSKHTPDKISGTNYTPWREPRKLFNNSNSEKFRSILSSLNGLTDSYVEYLNEKKDLNEKKASEKSQKSQRSVGITDPGSGTQGSGSTMSKDGIVQILMLGEVPWEWLQLWCPREDKTDSSMFERQGGGDRGEMGERGERADRWERGDGGGSREGDRGGKGDRGERGDRGEKEIDIKEQKRFEEFGMRKELKKSKYRGKHERREIGQKGEIGEKGERGGKEEKEELGEGYGEEGEEQFKKCKYAEMTDRSESSEDNWRDVSEKEIYSRQFLGVKDSDKSPTIMACDAINLLLNDNDNIYDKYHDNIEDYKNNEGVRNSEMSEGDIYIQNLATLADYCEEKLGGDEKERKGREEYGERREGKERKECRERGERGGKKTVDAKETNENKNSTDEKGFLDEQEARKKFVIRKWAMEEKSESQIIDEINKAIKNDDTVKKHENSHKHEKNDDSNNNNNDKDNNKNDEDKGRDMSDKEDYEERILDRHVENKNHYNDTANNTKNNSNSNSNNRHHISDSHSDSSIDTSDSEGDTGGEYGEYSDYCNGEYGEYGGYYGNSKSALDSGFGSHDEMRGETKEQNPQEISVQNTPKKQMIQKTQNIQNVQDVTIDPYDYKSELKKELRRELRTEEKKGVTGVTGVGVIGVAGVKAGDIAGQKDEKSVKEETEFYEFNKQRELQDDFIFEDRVKTPCVTVTVAPTVPPAIVTIAGGGMSPLTDRMYVPFKDLESADPRSPSMKRLYSQTSPPRYDQRVVSPHKGDNQGGFEGAWKGQKEGDESALHRAYTEGNVLHSNNPQYLQRTYSGQGCKKGPVGKKIAGHRSSRYEGFERGFRNACLTRLHSLYPHTKGKILSIDVAAPASVGCVGDLGPMIPSFLECSPGHFNQDLMDKYLHPVTAFQGLYLCGEDGLPDSVLGSLLTAYNFAVYFILADRGYYGP